MLRICRFFLLSCVLSVAVRSAAAEPVKVGPDPVYEQIGVRLARRLPRYHLTRSALDDGISAQTWTNYLDSLDYNRVYFLASDIATFRQHEVTLDDELQRGDMSFAYEVFDVFKARVRERHAYVTERLDQGFDLTRQESFKWKRKASPRATDRAAWNELWRKKLKNEYVRQIVARELAIEAAAQGKESGVESDEGDSDGADGDAPETAPPPRVVVPGGEDDDVEQDETLTLSPEALIAKRYEQFKIMLEDSDAEWVLEKYLSAFAQAYDPHSAYMSPSSLEDFSIEMKLSLVGIGALLRSEDGAAKIVRLIPGGPAARDKRDKRLKPGDKIVGVGQDDAPPVDILHWPLYKVVRLIRGKRGTKVVLVVVPASDPSGLTTKRVDLLRDEVKLEEQACSAKTERVTGSDGATLTLGILKVPAFYANMNAKSPDDPGFRSVSYDAAKILRDFTEQGVSGVVLDLRSNGGGSLLEAIKTTGLFIKVGPAVQVRERFNTRTLYDEDRSVVYAGPLIVLVNRLSASASEIVAGALQDHGRAIIVGDSKTHGKGTVQTIVELGPDTRLGVIKVTTASYYRISGGSTQLKGIIPDIIVPSAFDSMEFGEEYLSNPIEWSRVMPVRYKPVADLSGILAQVKERSEQRRAKDAGFTAYMALLQRIGEMNRKEAMPLDLAERKQFAMMEKDVSDLQTVLVEGGDGREGGELSDLVLGESLRILADVVALWAERGGLAFEPGPVGDRSLSEVIAEWLHNL